MTAYIISAYRLPRFDEEVDDAILSRIDRELLRQYDRSELDNV